MVEDDAVVPIAEKEPAAMENGKTDQFATDYLPHPVGHSRIYQTDMRHPSTPGFTSVIRDKMIYKKDGLSEKQVDKVGGQFDGLPLDWFPNLTGKPWPSFTLTLRCQNGFCELGTLDPKTGKMSSWEPILKMSAKDGDSWEWKDASGVLAKYQIKTDLKYKGRSAVQVTKTGQGGGFESITTTTIYVRGVGEVEQTKTFRIKEGKHAGLESKDVKRLVESTEPLDADGLPKVAVGKQAVPDRLDTDKLIGVWLIPKNVKDPPNAVGEVELSESGKLKFTVTISGETVSFPGSYKIEDRKLTMTVKFPQKDETLIGTIKSITESVLLIEDLAGIEKRFTRKGVSVGVKQGEILKVDGQLTNDDPKDRVRRNNPHKVHSAKLEAGKSYVIDLVSTEFDTYLRLEDSTGQQLAEDDDSGGNLNARIIFRAPKSDTYRIIATAFKGVGQYTLTVREGIAGANPGVGQVRPAIPGGRKLDARVKTTSKDNLDQMFTQHLQNLSVSATKNQIVLDFDVDRKNWQPVTQSFSLLVRVFDKDGTYLTHFTTKESFTASPDVYDGWMMVVNRLKDAPPQAQAELLGGFTPKLLEANGNRLIYNVNPALLQNGAIVEVGLIHVKKKGPF